MNTIRSFVAIPLPQEVKTYLSRLQKELRKSGIRASWPSPSGMHLTVKFIGDIYEKQIPGIQNSMIKAAKKRTPFELIVSGIGGFPSKGHARVIWSGVEGKKNALEGLVRDLDWFLSQEGIKKSKKKYAGHVTLARAKKTINLNNHESEIQNSGFGAKVFLASEMLLFKSILLPSGAKHEKIFSVTLVN